MTDRDSPFLRIPESDWVASNDFMFAVRCVSRVRGPSLVILRRLAVDWGDVTTQERLAILALVDEVKSQLRYELHPDGFNLGITEGTAAGQTVFHLHVHVIPASAATSPDPRAESAMR